MSKKMKFYVSISFPVVFIFLLFVGSSFVLAQSKSERKGDLYLESLLYSEATNAYLKAFNEDGDNDRLKLKIARCQHLLNNPEETVLWYGKVMDSDGMITSEDKFDFAMALMEVGKVEEARKWFGIYSSEVPADKRARKFIAQLEDFELLFQDSGRYELRPATFNSLFSDFCPAYFDDNIVFVSTRTNGRRNYSMHGNEFSDLYVSTKNRMGIYSAAVPFNPTINTEYHEGPAQFYNNDTKLVLTRNNVMEGRLVKGSSGVARLNLHFYQQDEEGNWTAGAPFPFNSTEYSVGHPAISKDGKTLYFVSDMPGGFGGTDIYVSHFDDSLWTKPQNLGKVINTKGNDMFPYLENKSTLYFASNGHGGLGGLDIFKCNLEQQEIENMGVPINSPKDDFGFIINKEFHEGYLSSNRSSGRDDDIFYFKILQPEGYVIEASILDVDTGEPVTNANVSLEEFGEEGSVTSVSSDLDGEAKLKMKLLHQYKIMVSKEGYEEIVQFITPQNRSEKVIIELRTR